MDWKLLQVIRVLKGRLFHWIYCLSIIRPIFLKIIFHRFRYLLYIVLKLAGIHSRSIVKIYLFQTSCRCRKSGFSLYFFCFRSWELFGATSTVGFTSPDMIASLTNYFFQLSFRFFATLSLFFLDVKVASILHLSTSKYQNSIRINCQIS